MTPAEAVDKARRNGHHLESASTRVIARWTCVVCDADVWFVYEGARPAGPRPKTSARSCRRGRDE